jgi:hypothetical protein
VVVDLSGTRLVDHTVMGKLHEQEKEFASQGRSLHMAGLEHHAAASDHPHAPRRRVLGPPAAAGAA